MNETLSGYSGKAGFLEHELDRRRLLLKGSLVEDEAGILCADFGDGPKRYCLREPSGEYGDCKYFKDQLLYASAASIQDLLDHPDHPEFEYECDLLTTNILATACLEGEFEKKLWQAVANEKKAWSVEGGEATRKWTPEIEAIAPPIYEELLRSGVSNREALVRTAEAVFRKTGKEISLRSYRRHLRLSNA